MSNINNKNNFDNSSVSLCELKYNNTGRLTALANLFLSNIKKYVYTDTNYFKGLNEKIMQEGLYHFSSEVRIEKILVSNTIKASGINASYGVSKTFFFVGIPEVGAIATNLDTIPLIATAVKVRVNEDIINSSKLKVRNLDDNAISYDGNFDLTNNTVSQEYFILRQKGNELVYEITSKEIYDNYANTKEGQDMAIFLKNKNNVRAIKNDYLNNLAQNNKTIIFNDYINGDISTQKLFDIDESIMKR